MKLSENKALKYEILKLPVKEKDKLLLRLIAKDKVLTEHLHFLLLEDESDLSARVEEIKSLIVEQDKAVNAKEQLIYLRKMIKHINHFLKVTKSVTDDVELRIFLLKHANIHFKSRVYSSFKNYEHLFAVFFVKSVQTTFKKWQKLHEDIQFDLKDNLNQILEKLQDKEMVHIANDLGVPKKV